jgi:CheY-like chemotaxis protein
LSQKPLVLLVDDSDDSREMYSIYLARHGFEIAEAATGKTAVERAAALAPDVIVMDLSLPDMDGAIAIDRIKGDPRSSTAVVLVVSGHAAPLDDARTWDAHLTKPCLPDVLEKAIRRALDARVSAKPS